MPEGEIGNFVKSYIESYKGSDQFKTAVLADEYDSHRNRTIMEFMTYVYSEAGQKLPDPTAANNRIVCNLFQRLNTQRNTYSLGNGLSFQDTAVKKKLGDGFDTKLFQAAYYSLIHGVSYLFWNCDCMNYFKATEFAPLIDENNSSLRAGIRFWQVSKEKPMWAVLYEPDGYSKWKTGETGAFVIAEKKQSYVKNYVESKAFGKREAGEENYSRLPIVPLYGSRQKQSTIVGMQGAIDAYDLVRSGFANDLQECSEIYWIINGAGGIREKDMKKFRDRLKFSHVAVTDESSEVTITPHTQNIPTEARLAFLKEIRAGIYEDFGALDVHTVSAGATNDHIDAAYQPMDENADDFEYQIIECVTSLLELQGITGPKAVPTFKRNRISNIREQVEIVLEEAQFLDDYLIRRKLPNLTPDEVEELEKRLGDWAAARSGFVLDGPDGDGE